MTEYLDKNPVGGTTFGQTSAALVAFYGATPVAQPSGTSQSAVATTAITTAISTAATNSSPYGYATAGQADAIVAAVNSLISRGAANTTLINQMRSDLVTLGILKGSA